MKTKRTMPIELKEAKIALIKEINSLLKSGLSTCEAIDLSVPVIMPCLKIDYTIKHGKESDQYGCKVMLQSANGKLTLVF